ncbi:MAG: two-component regulator propeller domain-containing protein [Oscillochloridaceae bacterium]|nr:hypothetical protein [Chloroflexaceae bacterium]MDW8392281.1 two-component regulator propeller domain-containing protein [Oscillochloridaceae bacterium]
MRRSWVWIAAGAIVALLIGGLAIYFRSPLPLLLDWRPLPAAQMEARLTERAAAMSLTAEARRQAAESMAAQLAHPQWTAFTSVNFVNDLLVDDKTVWVATNGGLACWDASSAEALKLTTADGLPSNKVTALGVDADGALWVGTDAGAVQVRLDGSLRRFTVADGLADPFVYAVLGASDGSVWFGTPQGATRLGRDGQVRTVRFLSPRLASPGAILQPRFADVVAVAEAPDGAIWLSTPAGVRVFHTDGRQRFLSLADLGYGQVMAFAFAPDGTVLMAINTLRTDTGIGSAVLRLTPDRRLERALVIEQTEQESIRGSLFRDLAVGADGVIWVATETGAIRLDPDGSYETIGAAPESGAAPAFVPRVAPGADGSIWFGTDRGIARLLPDGAWQTLQDSDGPVDSSNQITSLARAPNGDLWVGTAQGLSRLDAEGDWQAFLSDRLSSEITALATDASGDLWAGTTQGVLRVTPDLPEWIQLPDSPDWPANAHVLALAATADGALWVGTFYQGVFRRDAEGTWRQFSEADGLAGSTVFAIAPAPDGALWFATENGVGRLSPDEQWASFGQADGLPAGNVRAILALADGSLLFAFADIAEGGSLIRRAADGTWQTLLPPGGDIRGGILSLAALPDETIWIGTSNDGLLRLGKDGSLERITVEAGLAGNTVNALLVAPDGSLWVATDGGLSRRTP